MAGRERRRARRAAERRHLRVVHAEPARTPEAQAAHERKVSLLLLLVPAGVLTVAGLVMILSAGSISAVEGYGTSFWYFNRQLVYAIAGVVALAVAWRMPATVWQRISLPMLLVILPLMLLALHPAHGTSLYGASRWIDLGPVTLQPAEFLKLAVVAFAATVLANKWRKLGDLTHLALPLGPVMAVVALLVILQRDLGTTIILCGSVGLLLFVAGVRMKHLTVIGLTSLAAVALLIFGETYRRTRFVDAFLDPWNDPQGSGFQLIQGLIALGSGGWTGVGLGSSRQKWDYLPNAHSDFIFAIVGEELGLLGALAVLALFVMMLYAGVRIAMRAPDAFGRFLAAGITGWIGLQAVVNLGAVTGLLPITGVPLPFLSFGGTALVVTLAGVGVLASVARTGTPARAVPASTQGASPAGEPRRAPRKERTAVRGSRTGGRRASR